MKHQITIKKSIKNIVEFKGFQETLPIRSLLQTRRRSGWPYCPVDEGDLLYLLAKSAPDQDALEVGFATGSTALYILSGLKSGRLTSIDYAQDEFEREGEKLIRDSGLYSRHELIEENSIKALPRLYDSERHFNLIFLDGWKTFDHIWVDTFYCARMLNIGGYMVFDDARMPAVRKCISILCRYYQFEVIDNYALVGGYRQRIWHLLSTRSYLRSYFALKKVREISATDAGRKFDFWKSF